MLAALIVSLAMSVSAQNFFLGLQGQSCAATCGAVGRTCLTNIPLDNSTAVRVVVVVVVVVFVVLLIK